MKTIINVIALILISSALAGCNILKSEKAQINPVHNQVIKKFHRPKRHIKRQKADLVDEIFKETDDVLPK